ncbi:MAG: 30S ribosomal protein S9 [Candidatus Wildermuthbacteria bacterium]|nr:30S ribosomal protein S9 [Candidatus Wildermuthbacteria bacterium]
MEQETKDKTEQYWAAVGRRKTAIASVRMEAAKHSSFTVNGKAVEEYFPTLEYRSVAKASLNQSETGVSFAVSVLVRGGGVSAQAEAVRHGVSRALLEYDASLRGRLKGLGFLTRDPRMRERKKFGLKRARRAPQWNKR